MTIKEEPQRSLVSLQTVTKKALESKLDSINKGRKRAKKTKLTRGDIIALAIENLTIEQGVLK
jgi:hypothetical protein